MGGPFFFLCAPGNEFMSVIGSDEATTMLYNIAVAGACSFGVAAVVSTKYKATPLPASTEFASMFAFVQSICWMHLMSNELVMSLGALAKIFGIDEEVFGVSFVAWGDGIGDLVACHAVAKAGQVTMAVVAFCWPCLQLAHRSRQFHRLSHHHLGRPPFQRQAGRNRLGRRLPVLRDVHHLPAPSPLASRVRNPTFVRQRRLRDVRRVFAHLPLVRGAAFIRLQARVVKSRVVISSHRTQK